MKYRVGDIVSDDIHMERAIVIGADRGLYLVKHLGFIGRGFRPQSPRRDSDLTMIKRGKMLELGDVVKVRQTGRYGTVEGLEIDGNKNKITQASVKLASGHVINHSRWELKLICRNYEREGTSMHSVGDIVKVVGKGTKRHGFAKGDRCAVRFSWDGHYVVERIHDSFEQVVSEDAIKPLTSAPSADYAPFNELIDLGKEEEPEPPQEDDKVRDVIELGSPFYGAEGWEEVKIVAPFALDGAVYLAGTSFHYRQQRGDTLNGYVLRKIGSHKVIVVSPQYFRTLFEEEEKDMSEQYGTTTELPSLHASEMAELQRQLQQEKSKNEALRKENIAKEYGVVTERHLWSTAIVVPAKRFSSPTSHTTEIVTEGKSMVEAAMAAEAMAKGINAEAYVLSVEYLRVLGAIK